MLLFYKHIRNAWREMTLLNTFKSANRPLWIITAGLLTVLACNNNPPAEKETATEAQKKKIAKASISDVEEGIRNYIRTKTGEGGGYFQLEDDSLNLNMRLVRVHTEYLSVLGPKSYFACVDLADSTGDVYDVDFFLSGEPGHMDVTQTTVHKRNGKPFYTWKQDEDKTWRQMPVRDASNDLLGIIESEDHFRFRYKVVLPNINGSARMWIPVPQSDPFQTVVPDSIRIPLENKMLEDEFFGNTIMYLELEPKHSGAIVELVYSVDRVEKTPYTEVNADLEPYLVSTALLPTGGRFSVIVDSVLNKKWDQGQLVQARALYDYIIDNVRYTKQGTYGTGDANYACDSRSGNCTEFHSLFISLARTAGIPARFAIGAAIPSSRNEGGVSGYHCWAEFYAENKWWPVDISEGNKYTALATYYFGHHPANRIEFTRGRDLKVTPGPTSGPIPFLAYPVLEMDGKELEVKPVFTFTRVSEP